ncbi:MAG: efflux transporter periplasmic adaptor subunit [Phycisphaeraceae bacterium]|nr:efflux transporter periplasmic adaptor subunit [Phycisphaeraceae bacterium]
MARVRLSRRLLIVPPIVLGAAMLAVLVMSRRGPTRRETDEEAIALRVIVAERMDVIPRAIGYGTAHPARVWRAVAEVPGRVTWIHPELRSGALLKQDAVLLTIDPSEYELAVAQLEAEAEKLDAESRELDASESNLKASLEIEEASLELLRADLQRVRDAAGQGASNETEIDERVRATLAQQRVVQEVKNSIALLPTQRQTIAAQKKVTQAQLASAKLDLSKTTIAAPFDCRVGEVDLQVGQYLLANELLTEASGIERTEVEAEVNVGSLRSLLSSVSVDGLDMTSLDLETLRSLLNLTAEVRLEVGTATARWDAEFDRVREAFNSQTRTARVLVAVDRPYEKIVPGTRPALIEGAFCEVELRGSARSDRLVVPRSAVRQGRVCVVGKDGRLERRSIAIEFVQSDFVCVSSGIEPGELVVISDPGAAPDGVLVHATKDDDASTRLARDAGGSRG